MINLLIQKKYELILLILIALFPIYKMAVISISILVFGIVSLLLFLKRKKKTSIDKQSIKYFFITSSFYLWMILSLLYTSNLTKGLTEIQHSLSLLLIPMIIFIFIKKVTNKIIELVSLTFVFACVILIIYLQYHFFKENLYDEIGAITFYNLPFRDLVASLSYKDLNTTYISMWFLFSILILFDYLLRHFQELNIFLISVFLVLMLLLFSTAILLSSRITMIAFVIALIWYLFLKIKRNFYRIAILVTTLIIFVFMILNISFLKSRLIDEFKVTKLEPPIGETHNSVNIRVGVYKCSWELLKKYWFIGIGVGDVQDSLNTCYEQFDTNAYKITTYNTHNQYFHIIISSGIIGFIFFVMMFYEQFKLAYLNKDYLYVSFMVFILVCFLTENVLVRIHGVLFFAYFNTLFLKRNLS